MFDWGGQYAKHESSSCFKIYLWKCQPQDMLMCPNDAPIVEVELNLIVANKESTKEMKVSDAIMYERGKQELIVVDGSQGRVALKGD